ncbi:glycerophosphodiester phosphodiesterase family protein [Companilactobacillus halodurans]|uniref:Glycerophosphoryl diester phosphodiesterase n=1 Tax=Companilactobacillus halodurans TaxID=2584183 RepID=A0A5P0ZMH7_9LACO|nr:glycerophosphodiester phosphodiesterase family protein [Companilactobacillus halodurans]MQS75423.1 glycerophosphoryl diester phosphodiesterase [Companilactobacillus halodurans]MQS97264.1 glycerophosphoryl diester phosphodiesterase [Companilactobacillus halodurans]
MDKKIIAHRGIPTLAPENTMASFNVVVNQDVKWIETDLSITKDEKVFVIHDDKLNRTTNQSGSIETVDSSDVLNADAGYWFAERFRGEKVPTLDQLIDFLNIHKVNANIELKGVVGDNANYLADKLVEKFAEALDNLDDHVDLIISSFNPIMLEKMYKLRPNLKYAVLFSRETLGDDWNLVMQACHAKIVHPDSSGLTQAKLEQMKDYGYEVNVWTVDDVNRAQELLKWGADGIITNIADRMLFLEK